MPGTPALQALVSQATDTQGLGLSVLRKPGLILERLGDLGAECGGKNSAQQMNEWSSPLFENEIAGFGFSPGVG